MLSIIVITAVALFVFAPFVVDGILEYRRSY
jgi:hypothetical protein